MFYYKKRFIDMPNSFQVFSHNYPSDISRTKFEIIRPFLEDFKKQTKPRTIDLYDIFCAISYVLKSGCQWRMLPPDFPKWRTVHQNFLDWNAKPSENHPSLLEEVLKKISSKGSKKV